MPSLADNLAYTQSFVNGSPKPKAQIDLKRGPGAMQSATRPPRPVLRCPYANGFMGFGDGPLFGNGDCGSDSAVWSHSILVRLEGLSAPHQGSNMRRTFASEKRICLQQ